MQALRLNGVGDIGLARLPDPEPGPGVVPVQVDACGICGTDRHLYHGEFPGNPPVTLGHEFCGIVVGAGPGAGIAPGTRVSCDPNDPCLTCGPCLKGRVNLCERNAVTGITRDGGFAPLAVFPARRAIALPDGLHPHHGAFAEPLACTLHGPDMGTPRPGEVRALVVPR
jgi:L-iditol 2-dehydrogenase